MAEENIDARLAAEVTHLSTKLMTEVAKLLRLEETILQLRKENHTLRSQNGGAVEQDASHRRVLELTDKVAALGIEKDVAEAKNKQLEAEVEDLTASLFNEANEMVLNASRETYNFKLKNRKLIEEIAEKDAIIDNLQDQLKDLKAMFMRMEDQQRSRANTPRTESEAVFPDADTNNELLVLVLYGPKARAVRFDLPAYQQDFKSFVYQLIKPDFVFDLASLKNLRYFRRIWLEEIEPCVEHIPVVSGKFINRWSKGKTFWNILVEGRAIIEPVSGINETFKLTYKGAKTGDVWDTRLGRSTDTQTPTDLPVAVLDPCAFCGENKDDMLEHARLYYLKLYGPAEAGASDTTRDIGGELHDVMGTYPLCNFCVVKLRAICDLFARLRMIHANIYKLQQNSTYDDLAFVLNFQFKRNEPLVPEFHAPDEPAVVKLYMMLLVIRAKILWSKIGIWDTDDDVDAVLLDEIDMGVFHQIVRDNVAFRTGHSHVAEGASVTADVLSEGFNEGDSKEIEGDSKEIEGDSREIEGESNEPEEAVSEQLDHKSVGETGETEETNAEEKNQTGEGSRDENSVEENTEETGAETATNDNSRRESVHSSSDEEFADTSDGLVKPRTRTSLKSQIDKDLDLTMEMLRQSIDD